MRDTNPDSGASRREAILDDDQTIGHSVVGRRIAIVHYGEGAELDPGHRSHRCGQLAASLVERGADVARVVPSFRQWDDEQRPLDWSGTVGAEGRLVVVPTRSFSNTRGWDRFGSLYDFNRGVAKFLADDPTFDLIVCGFPPPGLVRGIKRSAPDAAVIADIRDLWPDALVPNSPAGDAVRSTAGRAGRVLARELRLADAVTAMSPTMLDRAPSGVDRTAVIPLGFEPAADEDRNLWPSGEAPMTAVFVGSMTQLFDLRSMIVGWQQFVRGRDATGRPTPRLVVVGDGPQKAMVDELVDGDETITCTGWVLGPEVPKHLAQADLGLAPTRPGQGTTISNKVAEYMAGGLFVLNTLTEPVAAELDASSLGARVESTPVAWSEGFETAERNLESLRSSRPGRIETATVRFGRDRAEELWFGLIDEVLAGRAAGPATQRQASTA
jgi:hypothetical protein